MNSSPPPSFSSSPSSSSSSSSSSSFSPSPPIHFVTQPRLSSASSSSDSNSSSASPISIQTPLSLSSTSTPSMSPSTSSPLPQISSSPSTVPLSLSLASPSPSSSSHSLDVLDRISKFRTDCLDHLFAHQTHNLIPHSGKVVVFDSKLQVKHAFDALVVHDINCAPVWDSTKRKYVGMLSVSDFLDILLHSYHSEDKTSFMNISNQRIVDWAEYKKSRNTSINRLLCISPESTLHEAVRQLLNYRVHRLCVVQLALADTVLRILTNHGILRFLRNNCKSLDTVTVRDLGIGVFHHLLTLTPLSPLMKALDMLYQYKVSSIPVVNEKNVPVDMFTRGDVRYLAMDNSWTHLDISIEEALGKHQKGRVLPLCTRDDTIATVAGLLVSTMKHSLICVDSQSGVIEGVVSLTDIFSFILNSGPPKAESRIAALKQSQQTDTNMAFTQANANMMASVSMLSGETEGARMISSSPSSSSLSMSLTSPLTSSLVSPLPLGTNNNLISSNSQVPMDDIGGEIDPSLDFLRE